MLESQRWTRYIFADSHDQQGVRDIKQCFKWHP